MINEIKRKQGEGYITFNRDTRRYYFENLKDDEIRKIYENGFDSPLRAQWRLTKLCNLNCKHCYLNNKNILKEELSKRELIKIAKKLIKNNIFEVLITGGEPTIKEGIKEVLEILCKNCEVTFFTNCYNKGAIDKILSILKKYRDHIKIRVSLDGPEKIHDSIRGKGSFNKTLINIKDLMNNGLDISINLVVIREVIPFIEEFINIAKINGMPSIQFSKFYPLGEGENLIKSMPSPKEFKEITKKLLKISKEIKNPKISFDHTFCFLLGEKSKEIDHRKCSGGFSKIVIESNGDVYPCQLLPLPEFKMGNILNDSLDDLWISEERKRFVQDFFPEKCQTCNQNKYCSCGCKASSYSIHKVFKYKDPYCFHGK